MAVVAANVFAGAANEKIVSGGTGGEIQAAIDANVPPAVYRELVERLQLKGT